MRRPEELADASTSEDNGRAYSALMVLLESDRKARKRSLKTTSAQPEDTGSRKKTRSENPPAQLEPAEPAPADEDVDLEEKVTDMIDLFKQHFDAPDPVALAALLKFFKSSESAVKQKPVLLPQQSQLRVAFQGCDDVELHPHEIPAAAVAWSSLKVKVRDTISNRQGRNLFGGDVGVKARSLFTYCDVLDTTRSAQDHAYEPLMAIHIINHVYKGRDHVLKNNARISRQQHEDDAEDTTEYRDQGFTRPKVLVLCPTRNYCLRLVNQIISHSGTEQQENLKRFRNEFAIEKETISAAKPADHRAMFEGNTDDSFRLGIKFNRKSLKLFSKFDNSDIIMGSPLGLRTALEPKEKKPGTFDFLSSIEIFIVDQADALLMQNFEHVTYIMQHLNQMPKEATSIDFSRVRDWYLDENAKFLRQTIVFSSFLFPELHSMFNRDLCNVAGQLRIRREHRGVLEMAATSALRLRFDRLPPCSPRDEPDERFNYFTKTVLPDMMRVHDKGNLIFIPSYFDFIRVRNYLESEQFKYGALHEYAPMPEISRARSLFSRGELPVLLYTERLQHFRRFAIKDVKRIFMYGPPQYVQHFTELLEQLVQHVATPGSSNFIRIVYSSLDYMALERIVGTERARMMVTADNRSFEFS